MHPNAGHPKFSYMPLGMAQVRCNSSWLLEGFPEWQYLQPGEQVVQTQFFTSKLMLVQNSSIMSIFDKITFKDLIVCKEKMR